MSRSQSAVHHKPPPIDVTPPPSRARPPAVEATTRELVMNDRLPRLRIPRARRDRAGAPRPAASVRRAVALASSGLVLISLAGVLSACGAAAGRHPAPPAASAARDQRGVLISATPIARLPKSAVAAELRNARYEPGTPALGAGMVRYGIDAYRVIYQTVNATGQPVRASGLVVFPAAGPRQLRLVSFATGTDTYKLGVPSTFGLDAATDGLEGRWSSELFGSAGFAVAEPDYVGMGQGSGPIELMVARSMATASLDVLTAARALAARHGYQLDPGVLAAGFSEGGSAAMALGRALQQGQSPFFRLAALAPISSPLDLAGAELPGVFNGQVAGIAASYYLGYLLTSWNPLYHLYSSPSAAFRQPYAARVQGLFDGSHEDQQVLAALPATVSRLITLSYLRLLRHPTGNLLRALNANSTCFGWTPREPVRLYAASGDSQGPPVNSADCLRAIRARGGDASLIGLGPVGQFGLVGHFVSAFLALPQIVRWFAGGFSR
ncbi:MAG TPA: hypothetical protein VFQ68_34620 [Streptosporangiaceae bacterium]|nr:hypothetical protein [Streptosporangiaceae bacterium]